MAGGLSLLLTHDVHKYVIRGSCSCGVLLWRILADMMSLYLLCRGSEKPKEEECGCEYLGHVVSVLR